VLANIKSSLTFQNMWSGSWPLVDMQCPSFHPVAAYTCCIVLGFSYWKCTPVVFVHEKFLFVVIAVKCDSIKTVLLVGFWENSLPHLWIFEHKLKYNCVFVDTCILWRPRCSVVWEQVWFRGQENCQWRACQGDSREVWVSCVHNNINIM
jgi:hypothetical protein